MKTILTATGQTVHPLPYIGQGNAYWPHTHERVLISYPNGSTGIQYIRKTKLHTIKTAVGE